MTARARPADTQRTMTLLEHLGELRTRVFRSALWVAIACGVSYVYVDRLYDVLLYPLKVAMPGLTLKYFELAEPFFVAIKIALTAGIILASPLVLLEIWGFVAPGLTPRERRMVGPVMPLLLLLFLGGVAFIYFMLLPVSIKFLLGIARTDIDPMLDQQKYFGLVGTLCISGGVLFELPAVLGVLGWIGLVNARLLWNYTSYAFIILMTVAAVITPTGDAFTMLVMTAPLMGLYLLSIGLVWLIQRTAKPLPK